MKILSMQQNQNKRILKAIREYKIDGICQSEIERMLFTPVPP